MLEQDKEVIDPFDHHILKSKSKYGWNERDGFLKALIAEVIEHGFKSDLCLHCGKNDECKHDEKNLSILSVVDEKMNHIRHKKVGSPLDRGQMLALVLYS